MKSKATLSVVLAFLIGSVGTLIGVKIYDYFNTVNAVQVSKDTMTYITDQIVALRAAYAKRISLLVIDNEDLRKELKNRPVEIIETIEVVEKEHTVEVPVYVEELPDDNGYVLWFTTTELPDEDNLYVEGNITLDHFDVREVTDPIASITQLEHSIPIQIIKTEDGQWYVSTTSPHITFTDVSVVETPEEESVFVGGHIAGYTTPDVGIGLDAMYNNWCGSIEYLFKHEDLRLEIGYMWEF
jgi:hypothetical protein